MNIYLITDTHLGHAKMLDYEARPVDFENRILYHLKILKKDDILIHLGDVCIGGDAHWHEAFFKQMPPMVRSFLVKGNHDGKSNSWYYEYGWNFVCDSFTWDVYGKRILFSHIPQKDVGQYDINIHGHCHSKKRKKEFEPDMNDKQKLLAVEKVNYMPVTLRKFIGA